MATETFENVVKSLRDDAWFSAALGRAFKDAGVTAARESFDVIAKRATQARTYIPSATRRPLRARVAMVDGQNYSPAHRAAPGGQNVWRLNDDAAWVSFEIELDRLVEGYEEDGFTLSWDDGVLWLMPPAED